MNFDYFSTAALRDELNKTLAGGRIQDILQLDAFSLGMEVYAQGQRRYLYLSADPETPRIHLVEGKLRNGVAAPAPLVLFLNSHVEGGKILSVRQPAWERILILDMLHGERQFELIIEPIERRANILLVEDGIIRDCIRRVGPDENRVRQLLPNHPYELPPPQDKQNPDAISPEGLKSILESDPQAKLASALVKAIHGIGPLLAKEISFRAMGDVQVLAGDASPRATLGAFQELIEPLLAQEWQAGQLWEGELIVGFSVYPVRHRDRWQAVASVSEAIAGFYGAVSGDQAYEAAKQPIRTQIQQAEKRLRGKLFSLKNQERDEKEQLFLKQAGELLLAYQFQIPPKASEFVAQYDPESEALSIKLDPMLSAVENAKRYFEKYEKAKRSRAALPELIRETERELRYLAQLETDLDLAINWNDIGEVQDALVTDGYWRGAKRRQTSRSGRSGPLKVVVNNGTVIWVGRNSRQNEEVTFEKGSPDDLWLHVRALPGAHVVIKSYGRPVAEDIIEKAASLAVYYSRARAEGKAEVMVTERRYVRKIKGGKTGMVRVSEQSHPSILAIPRSEDDLG